MQPSSSSPFHPLRLLLGLFALLLLGACATPPSFLSDTDVIPVGSRIEFWVDHDDQGWRNSNLHIAFLPREMTGAEARRWAEGIGSRDAGLHWTRYYLLVTHPGHEKKTYRSSVHPLRAQPHEMTRHTAGHAFR
jgi:hypothetical protein